MKTKIKLVIKTVQFLACVSFAATALAQHPESFKMVLTDGWKMQSATIASGSGENISQAGYSPAGWYPVSVPTTIIAGLLANKVYDFDPFYDMNFEKLKDTLLDFPWWFRKEFVIPVSEKGRDILLRLHGINYKANVWLNGVLIADSNQVMNPYRIIELNVSRTIHFSGVNTLALQIRRPFRPDKNGGDLAIDYADWIHYPPDYNGGIINNIELKSVDRVGIQYPLVTTHFDHHVESSPTTSSKSSSLNIAHLTVDAMVYNYSATPQDVVVKGKINADSGFSKKVHLDPGEIKEVTFTPEEFPQLNVKNPRIWWPWQYGRPDLNHIELSVLRAGVISNSLRETFGIREITSRMIDNKTRVFVVNGKRIVLRGAAWSPDIFQRRSAKRQEQEIRLYRDMNMNIVRSEGKMEDDHFYALCDKYGMLVMTGWMCCGAWQYPENWDAAKRASAMASDSSVMLWLRNKPSVMVWLNGSDMPPRDTSVERSYLNIEASLKWPNPTIGTADASKSLVSGFSGVKMEGPYEWVPPIYWETDSLMKRGGAWSFATEISPGPSIPPYESLIKFIPKDSLWFTSASWKYHCGTMTFGNTNVFTDALEGRYGKSTDIKDYIAKAQAQNYESHRAMMEAYGLRKYHNASGVVQWMGSNPWPGLIWHTYDYYLYPAGTYFGMKKSMEPLHIMYSYAGHEVDITNSLQQDFNGLSVKAEVYNLDGSIKFAKKITANVGADSVYHCFAVPEISGLSDTYFLRLELKDASGQVKSINWYWLSKKGDVLDWANSKWYMTPQSGYADYSALQHLNKTTLKISYTSSLKNDSTEHAVTITNTGKTVAFQVHLRALKGKSGDDILPGLFSDNYLELAPGESRVILSSYFSKDAGSATPFFLVSAWNLDAKSCRGTGNVAFADQP
jgi:exo-1,4-beta-D-glucosaminidase